MALATAKLFVEEGAYVFITGRRQDKLDEAVKSIGRNVTGVQGDAAVLTDLDRLYTQVKQEKGHIDVLFASAGQGGARQPLGSIPEEDYYAVFDLNVRGTLFTVQKALPLFRDNGSIVMNGSIAAVKGMQRSTVYSASKAAVRSFARVWAAELKDRRIRANVLSPGPIDTAAMAAAPEETRERFRLMIPRQELGRSEEIATAALFLASDDASFVNGVELFVDGGLSQI
jgi:NAD(P)-dependent dehydrogenase (short-subunit alcohol dehydrogenase family)